MDQNEVVQILRSCLISCKGGIKLDSLREDYRMIAGEPLPFKKFGFPSIEAFIRNMPDFTLMVKNGELYVDAIPSKTTAHLTKLVSRQRASRQRVRRKTRTQAKKYTRYTPRGYAPAFKNNGPQSMRSSYQNSSTSFTKSTPGRSNLYTDFSRPAPLMETIVQCPLHNNDKSRFALNASTVSPSKRLNDKITNPNVSAFNQSLNKSKNMEEIRIEVLNERAVPSVINTKPKTVELKPSKLSERLKITPITLPPTNNNGHTYVSVISDTLQVTSINNSDPRKKLEIYANTLELPSPVYKMYTQKAKDSSSITIYASVKIGEHTFHTFPDDAKSVEEAEKIAARLALMNLAKEPSSPEVTTIDVDLVKERILIIITRHQGGVFMYQLPVYYSEQYGEALPHNWQRMIEECPDINQERGVGNSTILCRSSRTSKHSEAQPSSRELHSEVNYTINCTSEKIQLNPIGPAAPDKLKVPEAALWNVYVTCVISTVEIWVRLVDDDYNDTFIDMMNEMTEHYNQIKEPAPAPACIVGDFYAILEDNYWHRVQCIDLESDTGIATVLYIDEGYEDQYKRDLLYSLEKKFCHVPAQAIRVALQGLEDFRDYGQILAEIENHLIDHAFCAKVHSTDSDDDGIYATVTLYDTSKEDDIDVNKVISDKIFNNIADTSKVHVGQLIELYVTHIDKHGKAYAQLNSFARTCLLNLLNYETMSQVSVNTMMSSLVKLIDFTKMYFVQLDSHWYRARVTDIRDDYEVTVFLIDLGRTVTALRGNLLHIDKISKILQNIPPQATQIFLHNIDQCGEKLVKRFNELVSSTDLLLAKVVRVTVSGVPVVEIFKRIGPNNMLASINTSLIYDEELSKSIEDSNNNIKPKKRLERKNSRILESYGKLHPPTISDIGQYFDVHVTLAAHPGHFIVQPLNDKNNLKTMMLELQKSYDACESPQLESIGEGKLYAAKFTDNYWYRVYVTNIISDDMVSVYLCDFGDVTIVSRSSLQPLKSEFLELSYQAVKAKLVGIQPMNTDWSVEDCLRFKDLVLHKNFVSIVVESMFDNFSPANSTVLGLRLIDVSTDKDIFIDELLVNEKRAKLIEGKNLSS